MVQCLLILYGLNVLEFFDKSLFCYFIQIFFDLCVLCKDEVGKLSYYELFGELVEGVVKCVLLVEICLLICQVVLECFVEEVVVESNDVVVN